MVDELDLISENENWVNSTLEEMSLQEKVGQLFCVYISDQLLPQEQMHEYHERLYEEIINYAPGGYYINRYYIPSTCYLINLMQEASKVPLFIGADMEYGAGSGLGGRIAYGLTQFPPPMGIGATGSNNYAYQMGLYTGCQAEMIGVNLIFAPVLDINNNPDNPIINIRSFGETAKEVSRLGLAYFEGLDNCAILSCAKHFPGHGNTKVDTHLKLATIKSTKKNLEANELLPFKQAIKKGIQAMMPGHLVVPALDKEKNPASMSYPILTKLLRKEMGFDGLIITDALLMGAITSLYSPGEAAVKAFKAGADVLLMPPDFPKAYEGVLQAVESGEITEERLDESVKRILSTKESYGINEPEMFHERDMIKLQNFTLPDNMSSNISRDTVTLLRNNEELLPMLMDEPLALLLMTDATNSHSIPDDSLYQAISTRNSYTFYELLTTTHPKEKFNATKKIIEDSKIIILALNLQVIPEKGTVDLPPIFEEFIHSSLPEKEDIIVLSCGSPYLIKRFSDYGAFLCSFGYYDYLNEAVAAILFGESIPHGRSPVTIPGYAKAGDGLSF